MKVLIACEMSGIVWTEFHKAGHDVTSCDLKPSKVSTKHYQGDLFDIAYENWDLVIAHPPCTYLCKAQMWRCNMSPGRMLLQDKAVNFVRRIYNLPCPLVAIENPQGALTKKFRPPDQTIFPYQFGDPYKKDISLWLKGLPVLLSTELSPGRMSMNNHTNSRMSQERKSEVKSIFFPGIAKAMVAQWT